MNKLKPLVTNEKISVVRKGQDGRNIPNVTNYMALTNHDDALVLDEDDRRYGVFFTQFKNRQHMLENTKGDYWLRLNNAINHYPNIIYSWLMNVDLSDFDAMQAPKMTPGKLKMIAQSQPEDEVALKEVVELGRFGVSADVIATDCIAEALREMGGLRPRSNRLKILLEDFGFYRFDAVINWQGKSRRVYVRNHSLTDNTEENRIAIRRLLDATNDVYDVVTENVF